MQLRVSQTTELKLATHSIFGYAIDNPCFFIHFSETISVTFYCRVFSILN